MAAPQIGRRSGRDAEKWRAAEAESPGAAVALLEEKSEVDLLVSDVVLPGMSGHELYQLLADDSPALRVLFISGYTAGFIEKHAAIEASAAVLEKPYSMRSLSRAVRRALDGRVAGESG